MTDTTYAVPATVEEDPNAEAKLQTARDLFEDLKKAAETRGRAYVMERMPPELAKLVQADIDAAFPEPTA